MKINTAILTLMAKFTPTPTDEITELRTDLDADYMRYQEAKGTRSRGEWADKPQAKFFQFLDNSYARVGIAFAWVIAASQLFQLLNPPKNDGTGQNNNVSQNR